MYAFRYTAYNTLPDINPGDYPRTKDEVSLTVAAVDETDALTAAKAIVTREVYRLHAVAQIVDEGRALDVEDY